MVQGSPPHLRGKRSLYSAVQRGDRITPAPAGKTPVIPGTCTVDDVNFVSGRITPAPAGKTINGNWFFDLLEDHPRTCGENLTLCGAIFLRGGSPPHLRGKPLQDEIKALELRITPAPAGKTLKNDVDTL